MKLCTLFFLSFFQVQQPAFPDPCLIVTPLAYKQELMQPKFKSKKMQVLVFICVRFHFASLLKRVSCTLQLIVQNGKGRKCVCFRFLCVFELIQECISLKRLCKPCMLLAYFHFNWNEI